MPGKVPNQDEQYKQTRGGVEDFNSEWSYMIGLLLWREFLLLFPPPILGQPEERTSASCRRLLNSVLGPAVAASPIGAFWAGFPFGVVDTLFVWTANNAVRNNNRFDSV